MRFDGKTNRQVLKAIDMTEYSAVTKPAHTGAVAVLMKRKPDAKETTAVEASKLEKSSALIMTSSEEGHQHMLRIWSDEAGGSTGSSVYVIEGMEPSWHDHPWLVNSDGEIVIGEVLGHTHEVERDQVMAALLSFIKVGASDRSTPGPAWGKEKKKMPAPTKKTDGAPEMDLQKALDRSNALAAMTPEHFTFMKSLAGDEAESFLSASEPARDAVVKESLLKAADADPVLYKAADGTIYRKSQEVIARLVKRDDEREVEMQKLRDRDEVVAFEKRATEELPHLPGTVTARGALLKAIAGISDETVRGQAYMILKAKSNGLAAAFQKAGHSGQADETKFEGEEGSDADSKLETMAKAYAEKNNVPFAKAYRTVLESDEGRALYGEGHPADV